ncbi:MAG: class I SAM-dependent methyltransferase [Desulfocapsa sp.]|nr:class I SAM-dependent methyltransferase [Desulfocapsa sp.]
MNSDSPAAPLLSAVTWISGGLALHNKAGLLAEELQLPLMGQSESTGFDILLCYTEDGLQLQIKGNPNGAIHVDFLSDSLTYRRNHGGGIKQALARAVGIKSGIRPSILDATAGLGKDSFLLASLGCEVTMIERSPLLAALLEDGLKRAEKDPELQRAVISRLTLLQGDAAQIIPRLKNRPDAIYLDPMYPHKRKSALNKQEMRIIRKLVGDDSDAGQILTLALRHTKKRVVVKRPKGAPLLNDISPTHVITMKNSRYDVYMI